MSSPSPTRRARSGTACGILALAALVNARASREPAQDDEETARFFLEEVRPVLERRCFECHGGAERVKGGLWLTSRAGLLRGSSSGPVLDLEQPERSRVLEMVSYADEHHRMPPAGKLPAEELGALRRWIELGAPWAGPEAELPEVEGEPLRGEWRWGALEPPEPPRVADEAWVKSPIDRFLLARLEERGLAPAPPAEKIALLRRATYDLVGLPPTPEEARAFLADDAPDAYERLVERLLASPHYGERWGRHWLDLVRYAETNGYERDSDKPFVWRYRDYVIDSFNEDKPYDRFVREQLAGDELDEVTPESLTATGYYRLMIWDDEPPMGPLQARYDTLDDIVSTTGEVFLGMTLGCARCHDHKGDPISQVDYYGFMSLFHGVTDMSKDGYLVEVMSPEERAVYEERRAAKEREEAALLEELQALEERFARAFSERDPAAAPATPGGADAPTPIAERIEHEGAGALDEATVAQYRGARARLAAVQERDVPREMAPAVQEGGPDVPDLFVHVRGNPRVPGERVEPAFPAALHPPPLEIPRRPADASSSGRRRALADWVADPQNPMTARVLANRLWQQHFGRGLVPTPNDFGNLGLGCTHPDLLDWLACELIAGGWRLKRMHREIMLSSAYRMSSRAAPSSGPDGPGAAGLELDPAGELFWRFSMRRLSAEELRDSMLAVSGQLNPKVGGPSFFSKVPAAVLATSSRPKEVWGESPEDETRRRSVYIKVKRSLLDPLLLAYDLADTDESCPVRFATTQPTQALSMINGAYVNELAVALAERLEREAPEGREAQVRRAIELACSRPATPEEVAENVAFMDEIAAEGGPEDALRAFCLVALNLNEFVYLD